MHNIIFKYMFYGVRNFIMWVACYLFTCFVKHLFACHERIMIFGRVLEWVYVS